MRSQAATRKDTPADHLPRPRQLDVSLGEAVPSNIIYMTGFDVRSLEREALGSVLKKPFSDDLLLSKVSRLLTG